MRTALSFGKGGGSVRGGGGEGGRGGDGIVKAISCHHYHNNAPFAHSTEHCSA